MDSNSDIRNKTGCQYSSSSHGAGTEVCAVIVSYNSSESVISCIDSSLSQVDKIIVIDNGSNPDVKDNLHRVSYPDKVVFIFNENNVGLAAALNQGLQYSLHGNYRWTLLLDQDSVPSENMVFEMIRSHESLDNEMKEKMAVVVPTVFDRNFEKMLPSVITTNFLNRKITNPDRDLFVHWHITSGSLIRNAVLPKIGPMNERFFIDYIDFDYCFRVLAGGYKILLSKNALLFHSLATRKQRLGFHFREHNAGRVYYQTRNRLFASLKYGMKYRSFFYSEICRSIGKLFKIIVLESDKRKKLKMYFKGIKDVIREYDKLNMAFSEKLGRNRNKK